MKTLTLLIVFDGRRDWPDWRWTDRGLMDGTVRGGMFAQVAAQDGEWHDRWRHEPGYASKSTGKAPAPRGRITARPHADFRRDAARVYAHVHRRTCLSARRTGSNCDCWKPATPSCSSC